MTEKIYITCAAYRDGDEQVTMMDGDPIELGFLTTVIVNAVRREFMKAGYSDFESKALIIGGIEEFWGKNTQQEVEGK